MRRARCSAENEKLGQASCVTLPNTAVPEIVAFSVPLRARRFQLVRKAASGALVPFYTEPTWLTGRSQTVITELRQLRGLPGGARACHTAHKVREPGAAMHGRSAR
jgi:hypothetical protein